MTQTTQDPSQENELISQEEITVPPASGTDADDLLIKIAQLEKQLAEMTAIAKRAQSDYFVLKMDFDGYSQRHESQKEQMKEENLVSVVKRVVPVCNTLKQMVQTVPGDLKDNTRVQGVMLTQQKLLSELETMNIHVIAPEP